MNFFNYADINIMVNYNNLFMPIIDFKSMLL